MQDEAKQWQPAYCSFLYATTHRVLALGLRGLRVENHRSNGVQCCNRVNRMIIMMLVCTRIREMSGSNFRSSFDKSDQSLRHGSRPCPFKLLLTN
jgi:hypothetical protein